MIDFSNGSLITPERVIILSIFGVGISGSCEDLVPERGVAICIRNTVWWLSAGEKRKRHVLSGLRHLLYLPHSPWPNMTTATHVERRNKRHTCFSEITYHYAFSSETFLKN